MIESPDWWERHGRVFVAPEGGGSYDLDNEEDVSELFSVVANGDAIQRTLEAKLTATRAKLAEAEAAVQQKHDLWLDATNHGVEMERQLAEATAALERMLNVGLLGTVPLSDVRATLAHIKSTSQP